MRVGKRLIDGAREDCNDSVVKKFASSIVKENSNVHASIPILNSAHGEWNTNNPLTTAEISRAACVPKNHEAPEILMEPKEEWDLRYLSDLKINVSRGKPVIPLLQGREGERSHLQVKVRN